MRRTTPNIRPRPAATMASSEPSVRPWTGCARRSSTRRLWLDRDPLQDLELAAADLDQQHVDEGLVRVVELHAADRRVGRVHRLEGVADRLPVRASRLLDRLL